MLEVGPAEGAALRLVVDLAALGRRPPRGASVAVAGVCLTVVRFTAGRGAFDVVGETVRRTTLGSLRAGDEVNLEAALRLGDEVGGHQVQGHVDGVGTVTRVVRARDGTRMSVRAPRGVLDTLVEKGWVAIDGVSLTVASVGRTSFDVALIPETLRVTTLGAAVRGTKVNLEGDPLGRHVCAWLDRRSKTLRTR